MSCLETHQCLIRFCLLACFLIANCHCLQYCLVPADCGPNEACVPYADPGAGICVCFFGFVRDENGNCSAIPRRQEEDTTITSAVSSSISLSSHTGTSASAEIDENGAVASNDTLIQDVSTTRSTTDILESTKSTTPNSASKSYKTTPASTGAPHAITTTRKTSITNGIPLPRIVIKSGNSSRPHLANEPCPHLAIAETRDQNICFNGGSCDSFNATHNHCICPRGLTGKQCAQKLSPKPFNESRSIQMQAKVNSLHIRPNSMFINQRYFDASTLGRNYAQDLKECAEICAEADPFCRSVNFGSYYNEKICELLAVSAETGSLLESWIKPSDNWTYAYFPQ